MSATPVPAFRPLGNTAAIGLACLFFLMYCVCNSLAKFLQDRYTVHQILTIVHGTGLFLTHVYAAARYRGDWRIMYKTNHPRLHLARMATTICTTFFVLFSVGRIGLTDFYGLIFTAPFFASLMAVAFLKERISLRRWALIVTGFAGVCLVIFPSIGGGGDMPGYLAALGSALTFSAGSLCAKAVRRDPTAIPLVFYPQLGVFLFNLPLALPHFVPVLPADTALFAVYALTLCTAVALNGYTFSRASSLSLVIPFQYTQIIWATLIGWLYFGERMNAYAVCGIAVIVAAGLALLFVNAGRSIPAPASIPDQPSETASATDATAAKAANPAAP